MVHIGETALRFAHAISVGISLLGVLSGCTTPKYSQCSRHVSESGVADEASLAVTTESIIQPDWASIPAFERVDQILRRQPQPTAYHVVSREQVQCRAAANSVRGNLLATEAQLVCCTHLDRYGRVTPEGAVLSNAMAIQAVDERNASAADALELFYGLKEAQLQRDLIVRSLRTIDQAIQDYRHIQERGLTLPVGDADLIRQRRDLLERQIDLELSAQEAQANLFRLLRLDHKEGVALSPEADLNVSVEPVDVERAVATGLAMRADMALARLLVDNVNKETLSAVRAAVQQMQVLLAASSPRERLLRRMLTGGQASRELQARRNQLETILGDRRVAVEEEIRQAAREVEARLRQAALAKQQWESLASRVEELRQERTARAITPFDIRTAELRALDAESDAIHALVACHVAEVKLREAQGLLAHACGYDLPGSCGASRREQAPFGPKPPQNEPVPDGFGIDPYYQAGSGMPSEGLAGFLSRSGTVSH